MSTIVLSGDTSGAITIAAPAVAGTNTLSLPANTGTLITTGTSTRVIPAGAVPAGSIIQVVQGVLTSQVSSTSSTYADTGVTATITPQFSTSKILVMVNHNACRKSGSADTEMGIKLLRSGSVIANIDEYVGWTGSTANNAIGSSDLIYLDSPASTSALIYKTQFANVAGTGTVYINVTNSFAPTSTITLMEIAQ